MKETHCTVTDLLPNAQYELWVTATNTTGISPASEKALYVTGDQIFETSAETLRWISLSPQTLMVDVLTSEPCLLSTVASCDQAEGEQQLPRSCSDPLGVREHQPCGLLHRGAHGDRF